MEEFLTNDCQCDIVIDTDNTTDMPKSIIKQMKSYLVRSNNIPSSVLTSQEGKHKWLSPKQKRKELLYLDWGVIE